MIDCPNCHIPTERIEHIFDKEKMILVKITPLYRCPNCKEEFYDFNKFNPPEAMGVE